jgi:hypothetical protein
MGVMLLDEDAKEKLQNVAFLPVPEESGFLHRKQVLKSL